MKVKIENTIYDSEVSPIMLILSSEDCLNIKSIVDDTAFNLNADHKYCSYPDNCEKDDIIDFMSTDVSCCVNAQQIGGSDPDEYCHMGDPEHTGDYQR